MEVDLERVVVVPLDVVMVDCILCGVSLLAIISNTS